MATKAKVEDGEKLLERIADQHRMIEDLRVEQRKATRRLAEMIRETKDHPDSGVNYSTAARAMGTVRSYTQALVRRLEDGQFD